MHHLTGDITRDREDINCEYREHAYHTVTNSAITSTPTKQCVRCRSNCRCDIRLRCDWIVPLSLSVAVINRNRRTNGGLSGSSLQINLSQQQQQALQPNALNAAKQVNKVKPNVNRQVADSAVSPSTYNRYANCAGIGFHS